MKNSASAILSVGVAERTRNPKPVSVVKGVAQSSVVKDRELPILQVSGPPCGLLLGLFDDHSVSFGWAAGRDRRRD